MQMICVAFQQIILLIQDSNYDNMSSLLLWLRQEEAEYSLWVSEQSQFCKQEKQSILSQ